MTTASPRWFWPAVAVLLGAMCFLMVTSIRLESQTYDEGFHITAGASYWMKGDYRLNPEHPPLAKLLCAIPVVLMGATFPNLPEAWANGCGRFVIADRSQGVCKGYEPRDVQ